MRNLNENELEEVGGGFPPAALALGLALAMAAILIESGALGS